MGGTPAPEPIVLRGHGGDVQCIAFATLGGVECLLSGDSNGDVVAWDLALRRPLWRLAAHPPSSGVLSVEATPGVDSPGTGDTPERGEASATRVLTQGRDGTLKCWRVSGAEGPSPDPMWSVTSGSFHFCRFASARAAAGGSLRALAVVGAETSAVDVLAVLADAPDEPPARVRTFRVPARDAADAADDADDADETLRGAPREKLGTVMACAFVFAPVRETKRRGARTTACESTGFDAPRGAPVLPVLVVGYEEGTVALWDARDCVGAAASREEDAVTETAKTERVFSSPLWRERVHGDSVTSVAADARRGGFVSASADGGVLRFAIEHEHLVLDEEKTKRAEEQTPRVFVERAEARGGAPADAFASGAHSTRGVACVAVRDDGAIFAAGGWDGRTRVYEIRGGKEGRKAEKKPLSAKKAKESEEKKKPRRLASLGFHDDVVACVAFRTAAGGKGAPRAGWLATGSRDGTVALWPIFPPKTRAADEGDEEALE